MERDNEDQKLIKPEWIRGVEMLVEEENLRKKIRKAQEGNGGIVEAIKGLKGAGIKMLKNEEWRIEDGMVLREGKIYMPEGDLRREIIQLHHDTPLGGMEEGGRQQSWSVGTTGGQG